MDLKARIIVGVSALTALFMLLYSGQILDLGTLFLPVQLYTSICLSIALAITFIRYRTKKRNRWQSWVNYALAFASLVCVGYVAYNFNDIRENFAMGSATTTVTIMFAISLVLILEATRRISTVFMVVVLVFFLQAMFCNYLPWLFHGKGYPLDSLAYGLYVGTEGIFATPLKVATTIVITYLLFGNLLSASGAGKLFIDLPMALLGHVRGGPAKVAVVASASLGTMTGSATSNVLTTGVFTIPLMKKVGYRADFAGAVEAVSSTGSQFTPPVMGGIIFIMSEWLQIPYYYICLAATIPAFLFYFNQFVVLDLEAARNGMKGLAKSELPSWKGTLKEGWIFFIPLILLVVLLMILQINASIAALYSSVAIIVVSWTKKESRIGLKKLVTVFSDTFKQFLIVGISCAAAGVVVGSLNITGLGIKLGSAFVDLSGGNIGIMMVLSAITAFIMGMGMPSLPIYVLLGVLLAPNLVAVGVPAICAHFFIVVSAILHFITPPVALACFAAASISGGDMMKTGFQAVRIGLVAFILPFWYVFRPAIMLEGSAIEIIYTVFLAVVSITALSMGTMGYALRRMNAIERIISAAGGLMLIVPGTWNNILGAVIIGVLVVEQYVLRRRTRVVTETYTG